MFDRSFNSASKSASCFAFMAWMATFVHSHQCTVTLDLLKLPFFPQLLSLLYQSWVLRSLLLPTSWVSSFTPPKALPGNQPSSRYDVQTTLQYQLPKRGASFTKVFVPHPTPDPNEICIRAKAVALNPLDWKCRAYGVMVQSWPVVLGIDAAGVIDSVGESVKDFKPGDEVFSLCSIGNRTGAFQEVITVPSHLVAKKPVSLTFEEAASLPICYLTAAAAVNVGLHVPLPHLDPTGSSFLKSILVLGGSSSVGAAAIQLLRLALPSATILTTSSAQHHAHLISLGATKCFERSAQEDTSAIKAATPAGSGVDAILDAVAAAASQPAIFTALDPEGPKNYAQVVTGQNVEVPQGINSTVVNGRQIFEAKGGMTAMPGLAELLESGKYKVPIKVEVLGKGFDAIEQGLDKLMRGVSGIKYVVSL